MRYFIITRLFQVLASQLLQGVEPDEIKPDLRPGKSAPKPNFRPPVPRPMAVEVRKSEPIHDIHARFLKTHTPEEVADLNKKKSMSQM